MEILNKLNSLPMYLIVAVVILYVSILCLVYAVRAYKAGLKAGIDRKKMKRAVSASATFAILPSVGILLGVIALAGNLGIPLPWFRLSVIGALHYETQVAQAAAEQVGISLSASEMTPRAFVTIALLMGFCICWGMVLSVIFTKKYMKKLMVSAPEATANTTADTSDKEEYKTDKKGNKVRKFSIGSFGDTAMTALFIGLVSAYIGSYIGEIKASSNWIPLAVAGVGALAMAFFTFLREKCKQEWVDSFSVAGSMIIAMASAILFKTIA